MRLKRKTIGCLIVFCFFISLITPLIDFTKLDFRIINPKTSTNYLFKDTPYNITLDDVYDDADPYKQYTSSYFQSQYKNDPTDLWDDKHYELADSGTDNNEVEYGSPSGDFEATYSFENDADGSNPVGWDVYEPAGTINVISGLDGHNKVVEIYDNDDADSQKYVDLSRTFTALYFGTIEFWFRATDVSTKLTQIMLRETSVFSVLLYVNLDVIKIGSTTIASMVANTWYHMSLDFECGNGGYQGLSADTFYLTIDGVQYGAYSFSTVCDYINIIRFRSNGLVKDYYSYVDAVGFKTGDYQSTESFDYTTTEGVYYGTYDFRDEIGESGYDIDFVDSINVANTNATIVSESNGHKAVMYLKSTVAWGQIYNSFTARTSGIIELWFKRGETSITSRVIPYGSNQIGELLFSNDGYIRFYNGTQYVIGTYLANVWYHLRMDFDCGTDTIDVWLNGVKEIDDMKFQYAQTSLNKLIIGNHNTPNAIIYVDAVGYSWDTTSHSGLGYKVGYNVNPYDLEGMILNGWYSTYFNYGETISVVNLDGHQNVLQHHITTGGYNYWIKSFSATYSDSFVEFWWRSSSSSTYSEFIFLGDLFIYTYAGANYFRYLDSGSVSHSTGVSTVADTWYHHKITFDISAGTFDWYIDDVLKVDNGDMYDHTGTYITQIRFHCSGNYYASLDALGLGWMSYASGDNLESYDQEYEIGDNLYPDNINMIKGSYDYTDNMLTLNAVCSAFTSTHTEGTRYESPAQFGDFTFTKGSSGVSGELETNNGVNYATLISSAPTFYPLSAEYINSVTYTKGSGSGLLSNTQVDDSNYYQLNSEFVSPFYTINAELIFDPALAGRDFYVSVHIVSSASMSFMGDGGTVFDYDNVIKNDLSSIFIFTLNDNPHNVKIYYLKLNEVGITPAELDISATWIIPDSILTFFYDYRTNVSVDCDLDIYNWDTTVWLELKSATSTSFQTGSYALTDPYISVSNQVKIRFQTATYIGDFKIELDQLTVSYIDDPAELEFDISTLLFKYNRDLLSIHIESHQKTNISQQIYFKIWNYDTSSYDTITSATETTTVTKREFNSITPDKYISSSGVKLYWSGINSEDDFIFSIDYLFIRIYYKMNLWHEVAFDTLGLWRYRWEIHGSLEYTDWTQFEVVEPVPNFHAISESDVSTRWRLQGANLVAIEDFHDDISGSNWDLSGISERTIFISHIPTDDAYVYDQDPDANYGSSDTLRTVHAVGYQYNVLLKYSFLYLYSNYTSNSTFYGYIYETTSPGTVDIYHTYDFSESTVTWNNQPATGTYQISSSGTTGWNTFNIGSPNQYYKLIAQFGEQIKWYSSEKVGYYPYLKHYLSKNYLGGGYVYMQTDITELISLLSTDYSSHYTLSSGDYFEIDFQTSSDSEISLILLKDGIVQKTLTLSPSSNTNFNRHIVQIPATEDLEFDQLKISSTFEDTDYCRVYDIKTFKYTLTGDYEDFYVSPNSQRDVYLTPETYNLKIYERTGVESYDIRENLNLTIPDTDHYVFVPTATQQCRLTLHTESGSFLQFEDYHITMNRSLYGEYNSFSLLDPLFYVDVGTTVYIDVSDIFDTPIESYSKTPTSTGYIDLSLPVYQLEIINLMLQKTTFSINGTGGTYTYQLASGRWMDFMLAKNHYKIEYYDSNTILQEFIVYLDSNIVVELNMSRICNLYYTNQKGEYLEFHQFKTYINETLLLQNVFYATDGEHKGIEVKDRYNISILNYTYVEGTEEYNQISLILTQYSLKLMNQQEQFNHINITRDPNYYESGYYWSEWIAPNEIIKFNLFAGYYKINLTDNENGAYSYYGYTLNGDDILLISSDNIISQVIYNIENVNVTLGNQITNVEINITNQNSQINQSIISVVINLENINSSLGDMLISLSVDIENINNNLTSLYMFTNTSFINLNNDMNNSFIYIENNIISINQSISNLVIGMQNDLWLINGSISTLIVDIGNDLLLMNTSIHTFLFALDVNLTTIGSNIDQYYILLNNSISLINSNVNDTRIAILNNLLLVNSSLSNLIMQVYDSVYLINNSIYTAVVDLGTYLSLINNSISGNLSIVLKRNEFLSAILQKTLFSEILNWTGANYNSSFIENQIDAWQFVNKYRDDACTVFLKYQDKIENLTVSAQNTLEQFLPKEGVEYRVWSESEQRYLDEWQPLPENRTVPFGFYEEEVPDIPNFNVSNTWLMIILIVFAFIGVIVFFGYLAYRYYQRIKRYKKANSLQANLNKNMIKDFSKGFSSGRRIK